MKQNQSFEEFDVCFLFPFLPFSFLNFNDLIATETMQQIAYRAEKDKMEQYTQKINSTRTEIAQLNKRKTQAANQLDTIALDLKKVENNLSNLEKNKNDAKHAIDHLLNSHPWISSEAEFVFPLFFSFLCFSFDRSLDSHLFVFSTPSCSLFGQPGTDYDFSTMNHKQASKNLEKLRQQQDKLSRSINQKVMNMFEV